MSVVLTGALGFGQEARAARDFARADELRAEIDDLGWEVQDSPGGFRLIPRT